MRGAIARHPGGIVSASAFGDTRRARKVSGRGGFTLGTRDRWHFPKVRPKKVSKEISKGVTFGRASEHKTYFEGAFGLTFGTRGMFRRRFEGGFQRDGFRAGCQDTWHSPKEGPEGVPMEASKGHSAGLRDGSERAYRSGFGDTWHIPKRAPK